MNKKVIVMLTMQDGAVLRIETTEEEYQRFLKDLKFKKFITLSNFTVNKQRINYIRKL